MRTKTFAVACIVSGVATATMAANGLSVDSERVTWPQWQARLQLGNEALVPAAASSTESTGLRPRAAALFGDYYVARPYFGQAGGLRVTSGLIVGPRGAVVGPSQANVQPSAVSFSSSSRAPFGPTADNSTDGTSTWPYLGVGYSDGNQRGGWGFSADLGLAAQSFGINRAARALGSQSLDDFLRDLRLTPVLQLGVSYRF